MSNYVVFIIELEQQQRTKKNSNRNLKDLKKVIKSNLLQEEGTQSESKKISKGIIFVRTRFLAHALASSMENSSDGLLRGLGTSVFTGTEAPESEGGELKIPIFHSTIKQHGGQHK